MDTTRRARAVVTGMGIKCPAGATVSEFWAALLAGTAAPRRLPDDWSPHRYLTSREQHRTDPVVHLAVAAATDALIDAFGAEATVRDRHRSAVVAGTTFGPMTTARSQDPGPLYVPQIMTNAVAAHISIKHRLTGPSVCVAAACATGTLAVVEAVRLIREGTADVVVAGGADRLTAALMTGLSRIGGMSQTGSRPFDATRDGFVASEGAAFLVVENAEHAAARGARIHGEIIGYGHACDAHHLTAPHPAGTGARACARAALADAGISAADVVHINAHGTSTPLGDAVEAAAIAHLFCDTVPVTSIKGVTGHMSAASGTAETIAAFLSLRDGLVPPTAGTQQPGPDCPIDLVTGRPRPIRAGPVASNSYGFGGHAITVILTRPQECT